ncbi:pyridoxal kinase [Chitinophaga sancti]|uniref:pyridoxal kinase n=1 Tax=Chitinophaga sancti TaxID=1004 RepID=UPI002A7566E6|nr:pyridoxal kinase [Chitinophaga sancti]WPQ60515.1 pyridoxal kinase [Chitinophaga sancti]
MPKNIISIQSQVASGYVGNNIAGFAIQLHGIDLTLLPTVFLSAHTGHPVIFGEAISPALLSDLVKGIGAINIPADADYLISGFCNLPENIDIIANTALQYPHLKFVYDPVFGDFHSGGLYFEKEIATYSVNQLLPLAHTLTPNHWELEFILQQSFKTISELKTAIQQHDILRDKTIVLTSANLTDTPPDVMEVILIRKGETTRFYGPKIALETTGTGDLFTAIITSQLTLGKNIEQAIRIAMDFIYHTLIYVQSVNEKELSAASLMKHLDLLK